jgi:adenosylmethionine-8-amino-7-oxononanoate aminotransferase
MKTVSPPLPEIWPVKDVRVQGAVRMVELDRIDDRETLRTWFVEQGVFFRSFADIVYLTPCFTIAPADLEQLTGAIVKVLRGL